MPRIMHISTRLILGGSQENTVLSCEGQLERGHTVSLVFGPIYGPEGSLLERVQRFRTTDGRCIEAIETPHLVRELSPLRDPKCYSDLRRLIRSWKPDVVHTHSSKAGVLGRLAAWKERVPCVVHTVHGPPFHNYERWWRNALYIHAERIAAKHCHRIVCVADAMREQFLARRIGRLEQYVTVYSGMEIEPYLQVARFRNQIRTELAIDEGAIVIGTIARLAELKGHDDLLDSLAPSLRSNPRMTLLWVGDGWWRERLLQRVRDLGLGTQVIATGLVPPERIPALLSAMDLLVHPSYREGLPRTVPQALLSEVPVVAYDVDGAREACIDRETGALVRPGDRNGLRDAVLWMIEHRDEAKAMAQRGRAICQEQFSASRMVEELEKVYASQRRELHPELAAR